MVSAMFALLARISAARRRALGQQMQRDQLKQSVPRLHGRSRRGGASPAGPSRRRPRRV